MTIAETQQAHERLLREYDWNNPQPVPYPDEPPEAYVKRDQAARKARNKALQKSSAAIFRTISDAQPKPEYDFQI